MAEMVEPHYGYDIIQHHGHTEIHAGSESVLIYPDRIEVGGRAFKKAHIHSIIVEEPDLSHVSKLSSSPPRGVMGSFFRMVAEHQVKSEIEAAMRAGWSVAFSYGESRYNLFSNCSEDRARSLQNLLWREI
ncbi:hypothetical protein CCR97_02610 [Rhodoplanes elegans]|uniref:Uncharacterized protein n=1 Tax=Rhodoplanes elegans TaxID=29408 RepID=A0A327KLQ4_9BRAD|nr:hypothetical protein [Rhodoplanes elegans]MBK5957108.1 hypothetical protein [Rhodoplanes elegans]RAI36268.1 hypothetical protein CH338_17855 [Rhodoplanes elegans]